VTRSTKPRSNVDPTRMALAALERIRTVLVKSGYQDRLGDALTMKELAAQGQMLGAELTVAATDYVRAYPQLIAPYVPGRFIALGTDGFGRSDTRSALRRFFEVDSHAIVLATLDALAQQGRLERKLVGEAMRRYGISSDAAAPWTV